MGLVGILEARRPRVVVGRWGERVVVYSASKTGSSTVYESLKAAGIRANHVHRLGRDLGDTSPPGKLREMRALTRRVNREPWKVVTLVRDPIARAVSSIFQGWRVYAPTLALDEFRWAFEERFEVLVSAGDRWFDEQPRRMFGLDVFARPFNREEGWHVYYDRLLLIKLERLSAVADEAFPALLGRPVSLVSINAGEEKRYARQYREFLTGLQLSRAQVEMSLSTRVVTHFYTEREQSAMRDRWSSSSSRG